MSRGLRHVTEVLAPYVDYSRVPPELLRQAADRGSLVHEICAEIARGGFVLTHSDPVVQGHVDSFRSWFDLAVRKVVAVELHLEHPRWHYCGRLDLLAEITGDPVGSNTLVDIKTPLQTGKVWGAQLAAYQELVEANREWNVHRILSVQTKKNGAAARVVEWTSDGPRAFAAFVSALQAQRYFGPKGD